MIALLILLLTQHAVVSARAGFVTYSEGVVNLRPGEHLGEDNALVTGPSGRVEMMLIPDSYVRMLPYGGLRLESDALADVRVVLIEGTAIFNIREINDDYPIHVRRNDGIEVSIDEAGVYLFEPGRVSVLDGEIRVGPQAARVGKGWTLVDVHGRENGFDLVRSPEDVGDSDAVRWNDARTEVLDPGRRFRSYRF